MSIHQLCNKILHSLPSCENMLIEDDPLIVKHELLSHIKQHPDKSYLALDWKIALEFHTCAKQTKEYPHDYGEMRRLRIELQELCGITELEALNVLIHRNVIDYIHKYNHEVNSDLLTKNAILLSHDNVPIKNPCEIAK